MRSSTTGFRWTHGIWQIPLKIVLRQIRFPTVSRAILETLVFSGVFLVAGHVSLGKPVQDMLVPMVPIVFIMMMSMVLSGIYRSEITNSIMNLYVHLAYGFCIASVLCISALHLFLPEFAEVKFDFFFLFSAFFVVNTLAPLMSGTDFMDGGGRRTN